MKHLITCDSLRGRVNDILAVQFVCFYLIYLDEYPLSPEGSTPRTPKARKSLPFDPKHEKTIRHFESVICQSLFFLLPSRWPFRASIAPTDLYIYHNVYCRSVE